MIKEPANTNRNTNTNTNKNKNKNSYVLAKFRTTTNRPQIPEDLARLRERHLDALRVREVAHVVHEHREGGRKRAPARRGRAPRRRWVVFQV